MSTMALTGLCHCRWGEGGGFVCQNLCSKSSWTRCTSRANHNHAQTRPEASLGTALGTTKHSRTLSDSEQDVGLIFYLTFLLKNASSKSARSDVSFGVRSRHTIGLAPFYLRLRFLPFGTMSWVLFRKNSYSVWPATPPPTLSFYRVRTSLVSHKKYRSLLIYCLYLI